jgi:AraC-like DNA-binding protein
MGGGELQILRVSSAAFPGRDRVEAFREIFGRAIMKIDLEPSVDSPLDVEMTLRAIPGLGIASGRISATSNSHSNAMIDNDDPVLVVVTHGSGSVTQEGRGATIENGQAVLTTNGSAGVFVGHTTSHVHNFRLDRALLASQLLDIDAALIRGIPKENPALRLLMRYAGVLDDDVALTTPELRRAVAVHVHDLVALVLGATRDAAELAKVRGVRAARLHAIKEEIIGNLSSRNLSADAIAARHGISPSYVRKLFEGDGTTFGDFVLGLRLAQAHRMFADARYVDRKISAIAFEAGFGDLSYFNNAFRRRYGMTPSDVRNAAMVKKLDG